MTQTLLSTSLAALAMFFFSCVQPQPDTTDAQTHVDYFASQDTGVLTGGIRMIPIETPVGRFHVWTKRIGNNPSVKLLLLHGGPGSTHEYFECAESYFPRESIEFYYYDQLGSWYSDQPTDTSLWNIERFVEEVEQVRKALGLTKDNFYLLGHSWGGWLAQQYALKYQDNLKGMIISNAMSNSAEYNAYAKNVLGPQLDPAVVKEIKDIEARGEFDNPRYMELLMPNFYEKFICRMPSAEWPDPLNRAFEHTNGQIYVIMQGPSEFGLSGKLEPFNVSALLPTIHVPTLVIASRYDTMNPDFLKWMSEQVQNGSYYLCPNGSHMCMWDDQENYMRAIIKWMKAVDRGEKKVSL